MPGDSPFLLVVDPNPEHAARVNSLLRNAGISVHVLHADNPAETERLIREFSPFLVYYLAASRDRYPVAALAHLLNDHGIFLGIALADGGRELFDEAAGQAACIAVADEAQLPAITRRLSGLGQAAREQDRMKAQEAELESRLDLLMSSTREPIAYFHEGLHVAANPAYQELLGVDSFDDLAMVSLLEILHRDDLDLKDLVRAFGRGEYPVDSESFRLTPPGGEGREVQLRFAPVRYDGEDCVQMVVHTGQVTDALPAPAPAQTAPAEPARAMNAPGSPATPTEDAGGDPALDPMTGMYLRGHFLQRLNQRLNELPEDQRAGVLFVTNDNAVVQTDELSVSDLDRYVQATADEVLSCVEDEDDVCRFSDSAFIVFALRSDKTALKRLGEKLRAGIEHLSQTHQGEPVPPSCSVGLVLLDRHHHDPETTVENARAACRMAAETGNTVERFKPARMAGVSEDEESQWRERLRYALDNEDFYTVQHAIMNLEGDLEGLVENRSFMHEDEHDVPAADYLPAAERNQLASQVDRLVIPGLLRAVVSGEERQIIDISGNSLQDFSFPTWFQRTLQETRFPGRRIVLQWPAWAARQQTRAARRLIEELSPLGVQFSVSGFDQEPKTLELLQELKLQFLTLDRELTGDLQADPTRLDAVREVIRAAEEMQVLTLASDVSTSGDLATLWRGGVKLVSGDFTQATPRVIGQ